MENSQPAYYTIKEFAIILNVNPITIRRAIKNNHINAFRVNSGKRSDYRIPSSEVHRLALMEMRKNETPII